MNQWTENYCEKENKMLAYNRFMKGKFKAYVASLFTVSEKVRAFVNLGFNI